MNNIISVLFIVVGSLIPVCYWLNARRRRRKEDALLAMSQCVNAINDLLLNGEVTSGDVSHDAIYPAMYELQFGNEVPTFKNLFKTSESEEKMIEDFTERLKNECDGKAFEIFKSFTDAYQRYFLSHAPFVALVFYFLFANKKLILLFLLASVLMWYKLLYYTLKRTSEKERVISAPFAIAVHRLASTG